MILVSIASTAGGVLLSSQCTFKRGEREILACFVADLRTFGVLFTGSNNAVVYQNDTHDVRP